MYLTYGIPGAVTNLHTSVQYRTPYIRYLQGNRRESMGCRNDVLPYILHILPPLQSPLLI